MPARILSAHEQKSAAAWNARLGCRMGCEASHAGETVSKLVRILKGEDPDP